MTDDYKPRFSFEISEELKERADNVLKDYGTRRGVFTPILIDVLDMVEEYGSIVLGIIPSGQVKPRDIIPSMKRAEEIAKKV